MRLYEFEGKALFRRYKIPVPDSVVIGDLRELDKVVYPVVVKAQVFTGGRSKAGAIKIAHSRAEAEQAITELRGKIINNYKIEKVLVERKIEIEKEFYLAAAIDRLKHQPLIIASPEGGIDIEAVARTRPSAVKKYYLETGERPEPFFGRTVAAEMGFQGESLNRAGSIVNSLYNLFSTLDCKLVEINPLALTAAGAPVALDAKVDLDEDGMFRHPELKDLGIVARHEVGELTERERFAKAHGIPYVDLGGCIGVFPGGAGFGIAAIDLIRRYGGEPANFMDSGGAPTQENLKLMLGLLMDNPDVVAIFGARFGGISRCDDWAKAVVQYVVENRPKKPMVMRMAGNMEEEGRKIFDAARTEHPELFRDIKVYAVDTPIETVIQETVKIAQKWVK